MLIELRDSDPCGLWPGATSVLGKVSVPLFNDAYKLRPPLGVYNISIETVISRMVRALDAFNEVDKDNPEAPQRTGTEIDYLRKNCLTTYQDLIYAMFEHLEDCNGIIKSFFAPNTDYTKDPRVRRYSTELKWYRKRLGVAVNAIKHNQNRLRMLWFSGPMAWSYGYFVEAVSPGGEVGPNPDVHAKGDTAISFCYDFRMNFVQMYAVSKHLTNFVVAVDPGVVPRTEGECLWACKIAKQIQGLRDFRFPNELNEPSPEVTISDHNGGQLLKLGLNANIGVPISITNLPPPTRVGAAYHGDGVTRSFHLPYSNWGQV